MVFSTGKCRCAGNVGPRRNTRTGTLAARTVIERGYSCSRSHDPRPSGGPCRIFAPDARGTLLSHRQLCHLTEVNGRNGSCHRLKAPQIGIPPNPDAGQPKRHVVIDACEVNACHAYGRQGSSVWSVKDGSSSKAIGCALNVIGATDARMERINVHLAQLQLLQLMQGARTA